MTTSNLVLFEQKLLERDLINNAQLDRLKKSGEYSTKGLFESLLSLKTIPINVLYCIAAQIWSVPFVDISAADYHHTNELKVPQKVLTELDAVTLTDKKNNHFVAFSTPERLSQVNQLSFFAQYQFEPVLANIDSIRRVRNQQAHRQKSSEKTSLNENDLDIYLGKSSQLNASDIHIEMFNGHCRLRIRVDGVLHPLASISAEQGLKLISQIKILSNMDIAQSRLPQDGRFSYQLNAKTISLRTNTIPTIYGEKLVLRILEQHGQQFKLNQLGLFTHQYQITRETLKQPNGLILIAGPTGSGKTVTLYALLDLLNTTKENISTIEDPVEIHVDGINQVSINRKAGLDFSLALRALLRQDPDILMVGEIRDAETAEIAVKAAQTGHLVMATVHSRSAASAKTRLLQLGIKRFSLDDALKLVIAQRLPRKLCRQCCKESEHCESAKQLFNVSNLALPKHSYSAVGCPNCLQGYSGRTGMFELLPQQPKISQNYLPNERQSQLDLQQAGLQLVANGDTSFDELIRVL